VNFMKPTADPTLPFSEVAGVPAEGAALLPEQSFQRMISLERKRSERSRKPFLLMVLDTGMGGQQRRGSKSFSNIVSVLVNSTRETDVKGWYRENCILGVMFTEFGDSDPRTILSTMLARISDALRTSMPLEQFGRMNISLHLYPEDWSEETREGPSDRAFYPDLARRDDSRRGLRVMKRTIDLVGGSIALMFASPIFLIIAALIKLTSKGPVFFRQTRIGQNGVPFTFLKFRSMYVNNNPDVHKEYVRRLIAGAVEATPSTDPANGNGHTVYKLTADARITSIGRILRRTSLDELPQLLNVLAGEMSLVGPRPAIAYEVEAYELWHRSRLLEAKPGITGLWQVNGRSRVKFDEMVRLDLRYARTWSPWLDIKILLQTPLAVVMGEGAY
jgi:lipopolysaccharide/colanic/teichoic acid biosynthesis glycosyltransferase